VMTARLNAYLLGKSRSSLAKIYLRVKYLWMQVSEKHATSVLHVMCFWPYVLRDTVRSLLFEPRPGLARDVSTADK
jgi:hypothetical protein